eukprot:TRINITY_DN50865_c0_g1_i1.p1 TRINITY_DN50865_c0_g1~~TRINITY_DN50865_c0_g1_i1.p1  ORF type:complete len:327 (+),score=75.12 TRINITY_DN50865_c0_g1_i1:77-982(+)
MHGARRALPPPRQARSGCAAEGAAAAVARATAPWRGGRGGGAGQLPRALLLFGAAALRPPGAGAVAGYGAYCRTEPLVPAATGLPFDPVLWSQPPHCTERGVQHPERVRDLAAGRVSDPPADPMAGYYLANLSAYPDKFCCFANYTAVISANTTVRELDTKARAYYQAASRVLARYDCRNFYPYGNCTPCAYAYRSWVCAILFPRACRNDTGRHIVSQRQKVCRDVCYEVVRKCPVSLEFKCPRDDTYGDWGSKLNWNEQALGPFLGECNPMQLDLSPAAALPAPAGVAALAAAAVAAWLH